MAAGKLLMCASCGVAKYCGRECQVAHWKAGHNAECKVLAAERKGRGATAPTGP